MALLPWAGSALAALYFFHRARKAPPALRLAARLRRAGPAQLLVFAFALISLFGWGGLLAGLIELHASDLPRIRGLGYAEPSQPLTLLVAGLGSLFGLILGAGVAGLGAFFAVALRFLLRFSPRCAVVCLPLRALLIGASAAAYLYWIAGQTFPAHSRLGGAVFFGLLVAIPALSGRPRFGVLGLAAAGTVLVLAQHFDLFLSKSRAELAYTVGLLFCLGLILFLLRPRRPGVVLSSGLVPVAAAIALFPILDRYPSRHYLLFQQTVFSRIQLQSLRTWTDRDGDMFSALLSGGDADDGDAAVNPFRLFPSAAAGPFRYHDQPLLPAASPRLPVARPPIFLILIDSARPRNMSAYGYSRPTTPALDVLAREAVLFPRAVTNGTATSIGIRHVLSGRYSSRYMEETRLPPFWTQELIEAGYRHFLVEVTPTNSNGIAPETYVRVLPPRLRARARHVYLPTRPDEGKAERMLEALRGIPPEEGIFCFLQYHSAHHPWGPRPGAARFGAEPRDLFDQNLNYVDGLLGRFFDGLKRLGLYRNAIIVVTADHGTQVGERGRIGGWTPYLEQIHVPMLFRIPGVSPRRVEAPVSLIDVGPTLVNLFFAGASNRFHGVSLLPVMAGATATLPRTDLFVLSAFDDAYVLLEGWEWKTVYSRLHNYWELYALRADPGEWKNLAGNRTLLGRRRRRILGFLRAGHGTYANPFHYKAYP